MTAGSHSGRYAWAYNPNGGSTGTDKRLVSRAINLSAATHPYLSFWYRLDAPPRGPGSPYVEYVEWRVRLSTDGGVTWQQHPIFTNTIDPDNYDVVTDGVWKWLLIPMPGCAGKPNARFEIRSWGGFTTGANLWIDDVAVVENLTARDHAKASLARLEAARGETSIGAGMRLAASMLGAVGGRRRIMVILTDGEENQPP